MTKTILFRMLVALVFLATSTDIVHSQIRLVATSLSGNFVTAENLCNVTISGNTSESSATLEAKIVNPNGKELIKVKTEPFAIKNGVFNSAQQNLKIASLYYSDPALSEYVNLYHQLPAGIYHYVVQITTNDGQSDELTEEIESQSNTFISLVSPTDRDTIETLNPLLVWTHSESFKLLQNGEFFRLVLVEVRKNQTADAAVSVNPPIFKSDFVLRHDILYPYDSPKLRAGEKYAWQIQKILHGLIVNKSEAWEFVFKPARQENLTKNFVEISPGLNTTPYKVDNGKIYFVFHNEYSNDPQSMKISIVNNKGLEKQVHATLYYDEEIKKEDRLKLTSDRFELNLDDLDLKSGTYILKIRDIKNQEFILNFQYSL